MTSAALIVLFATVSQTFNLPSGLLPALCFVESNHDVEAINVSDGGSDSLGVCQIKVATAHCLGFKGTATQLSAPSTNVYFAGKYLRWQLDRYGGNLYKAVGAYNSGTYKPGKSGKAKNHRYISKVMREWK